MQSLRTPEMSRGGHGTATARPHSQKPLDSASPGASCHPPKETSARRQKARALLKREVCDRVSSFIVTPDGAQPSCAGVTSVKEISWNSTKSAKERDRASGLVAKH
jgi:hypothetical protein